MICSSGRSTTSMAVSLRMLDARTRGSQSETGLGPKAKWGLIPVSVLAQFVRLSGLCFVGVRVKAKRNGYFSGCHWETLAPRPPEYGHEEKGPVQFQWVMRCSILSGDGFFGSNDINFPHRTHHRHHPLSYPMRAAYRSYSPSEEICHSLQCPTEKCPMRTKMLDRAAA